MTRTHPMTKNVTGRRLAGLGAAALAAIAFAAPAQAAPGIGAHGPLIERTGFLPEYYQDAAGLRLQLCLDFAATCGAVATPDPGPISFPGNFPDELFYWSANGTASSPGNSVDITLAQEATFAGVDGTQAVFGRLRLRGTLATAGRYRFTTPYGQYDRDIAAGDRNVNESIDVGCGPAIGPVCVDAPVDTFADTDGSEIGPNFLTWPDFANDPALPSGFVGDAATPHAVTGSTFVPDAASINPPDPCDPAVDPLCTPATPEPLTGQPANYFRVDRITAAAAVVENVATTSQFVITGKVADDPPAPYLLTTPGAAGNQPIADGPRNYVLTVRNGGSGDLKIATASVLATPDFTVTGTDCTNSTVTPAGRTQAPTGASQTCTVNVAFDPSAAGAKFATLQIAEQNGGPVHDILLTGVGTQPLLGSDQDGLSFGVQTVGTTAPTMTAVVRNAGNAPLLVTGASLSGSEAGDYAIIASACNGTTLAPNATCAIDVQFTPRATSVRNASLDIRSAAGSKSLSLSGLGSAPGPGPGVTIIQQGTPGPAGPAGTGVTGGAGTIAALPELTLTRLGTARKIKRSTASKRGIRLHMELTGGTQVLKINVYRRGGGKLALISSGYKTPGRTGAYAVRLSQPALRRALRKGIYEVHVTPGRSKTDLGTTSKFAFTVI